MSTAAAIRSSVVAIRASGLAQNVQKLVFGVGSYYWPKSRESVGLRLVDTFSERLGWRWSRLASAQCDVAQRSGILLVKPLTYVRAENARSLGLLRQMVTVEAKNIILVFADANQAPGEVRFGPAAGSVGDYLEAFVPDLQVEHCEHLSIGIGKPEIRAEIVLPVALTTTGETIDRQYLANVFPPATDRLLTSALERGLEILKRETGR